MVVKFVLYGILIHSCIQKVRTVQIQNKSLVCFHVSVMNFFYNI